MNDKWTKVKLWWNIHSRSGENDTANEILRMEPKKKNLVQYYRVDSIKLAELWMCVGTFGDSNKQQRREKMNNVRRAVATVVDTVVDNRRTSHTHTHTHHQRIALSAAWALYHNFVELFDCAQCRI